MFNKKSVITLLAVLSMATTFLKAQNTKTSTAQQNTEQAKLIFSDESTANYDEKVEQIFKDGKGAVYVVKTKGGSFMREGKPFIEKFDNTLKKVFEKEIIAPTKSNRVFEQMNVFFLNNKATFFYKGISKTENGQIFTMTMEEDGTFNKPQQLGDFDDKEPFINCNITLSQDSSKLMLFAELKHTSDKLPISFRVFDSQLKEIWKEKKDFKTSETSKQWSFDIIHTVKAQRSLFLDNSGTVFIMVPVGRVSKKAGKEVNETFYQVHQFTQGETQPKVYSIDFGKKVIYNIELTQSKKANEVICFGTYAGTSKVTLLRGDAGVMGTFQCRLDVQKGVMTQQISEPFTDDIFDTMEVSDKNREAGDGIKFSRVRELYVTDSNNLIILLEQNYYDDPQSNMTPKPVPTSNSNTAFLIKYAADGKVVYQKYISKKLKNPRDFGFYTTCLPHQEEPILLFNLPQKGSKIPKFLSTVVSIWADLTVASNAFAYTWQFDKEGEHKEANILNSKENPFVIQPLEVKLRYAPNSVIVISRSRKDMDKFKLLRLDY